MGEPAKDAGMRREDDERRKEENEHAGVNASVGPRIVHPHKGDVGRAGTNEEIYQGSKMKELKPDAQS